MVVMNQRKNKKNAQIIKNLSDKQQIDFKNLSYLKNYMTVMLMH